MKKIIAYSLWGNNPKYTIGAIKNANLAEKFYPGWVCRFYCSSNVSQDIIKTLEKNSEVVVSNDNPDWTFTTKRFLPMSEKGVERVIFRDTDSRFTQREVDAVNEWVLSENSLHIMKDHPFHGGFPILAGMFGIVGGMIMDVEKLLQLAKNTPEQYHYDQIFLQKYIWNVFKNDCTVHDEFFLKKPFPSARNGLEFVGEPFNADDTVCDSSHREILKAAIK
jgi:hypothetical protein